MAKEKTETPKTYTPHPGLVEMAQRELFLLERRSKMKISVRPPNFIEKNRLNKKPKKTKKKIIAWSGSKFIK